MRWHFPRKPVTEWKGDTRTQGSPVSDGARTVLITGGNAGLGFQCALRVLGADERYHVVIACRSEARARAALDKLLKAVPGSTSTRMGFVPLDLSSLASTRACATRITTLLDAGEIPPLGAIVCNAGVQPMGTTPMTADGMELTFQTNHLGHFLLVNLLVGRLARGGRIVLVSSDTHDPSKKTGMPAPVYTTAEDLAHPQQSPSKMAVLDGRHRYTISKLCNVYCMYELAARASTRAGRPGSGLADGITVNAFNPCMMPGTGLARDYSPLLQWGWEHLLPLLTLVRSDIRTPEQSGCALARLVCDSSLAQTSGRYFDGMDAIDTSPLSHDEDNRRDLWETSVRLSGLGVGESPLL